MREPVTDLVSILRRIEEEADTLIRDGRFFANLHDAARLIGWLRAQPRSRILLFAALGAGVVAGMVFLVGTINRPVEPNLEFLDPDLEERWPDPDPDWG